MTASSQRVWDLAIRMSPYSSENWHGAATIYRDTAQRSREGLHLFLREKRAQNISMGYLLDSVFILTFLKTN